MNKDGDMHGIQRPWSPHAIAISLEQQSLLNSKDYTPDIVLQRRCVLLTPNSNSLDNLHSSQLLVQLK